MKVRFVLVEFDEFLFDNFKDEIQFYSYDRHSSITDVTREGIIYNGHSDIDGVFHNYTKDELYMAIPVYLYETFSNLIRIEPNFRDWRI